MTTAATTTATSTAYEELIEIVRSENLLAGTAGVLSWDQEVLMPPGGVEYRSRQLAQLARLRHQAITAPRVGELLGACEGDAALTSDPLSPTAVNVRELRRNYDRKTKLPPALVEEEARLSSVGHHLWTEARSKSNFEQFQPVLEEIVDLLRRKAERYGWGANGEPWDALAEDYEPGCTAREVETVFTPLRDRLQRLLGDLMASSTRPSNEFNARLVDVDRQRRLVRFVSEAYGFDYQRGRLDVSTHPFCGGSHCNDVRLTTRFGDANVNDALGSTMHETGHGLYEQGLSADFIGLPMGTSVSLGIHESQSRLWENQVGRSLGFWKWLHPKLGEFLGDAMDGLGLEEVYGAANIVTPSFIRVEADEATYNMHVMVRFEIERAIMSGDLAVRDIPGVWNEKYKAYLGVDVPDNARGCLQDVHWACASMGYFPTYTLGNLYCAQFFERIREVMPDIDEQFERGEFGNLKTWLNENIHDHGRRYRAAELCEVVTGKPLSADPLMRHLEGKLRPLYGI